MSDLKVYILKRILSLIPVLVGISIVVFCLGILSPGDPVLMALDQNGLSTPSAEQIETMRTEMGLDKPVLTQYTAWLGKVLHGNLGTSYTTGRSVTTLILERFPNTLWLALSASFIAMVGGISLGITGAVYKEKWPDVLIQGVTSIMLATPGFWLALILILILSEILKLLPTSGTGTIWHLIMPALVLSFGTMATIGRLFRAYLLSEFEKPYFLVAKFRGVPGWRLIVCEAFPNAIIPVISLVGNYFGHMLGGAVITESIFAIPGIGSLAIEAIKFRDLPVLQGNVLLTGIFFVVINIVIDFMIILLNPKVRINGGNRI